MYGRSIVSYGTLPGSYIRLGWAPRSVTNFKGPAHARAPRPRARRCGQSCRARDGACHYTLGFARLFAVRLSRPLTSARPAMAKRSSRTYGGEKCKSQCKDKNMAESGERTTERRNSSRPLAWSKISRLRARKSGRTRHWPVACAHGVPCSSGAHSCHQGGTHQGSELVCGLRMIGRAVLT